MKRQRLLKNRIFNSFASQQHAQRSFQQNAQHSFQQHLERSDQVRFNSHWSAATNDVSTRPAASQQLLEYLYLGYFKSSATNER